MELGLGSGISTVTCFHIDVHSAGPLSRGPGVLELECMFGHV